jgi:VWFA-related protein
VIGKVPGAGAGCLVRRTGCVLLVALSTAVLAGGAALEAQRGSGTGTGGGTGRGTGGGTGPGAGQRGGGGAGRGQAQPVFRAGVELVEIDVVVVDRTGQAVHGLTRDDFIVRDRREPRGIETFEEIQREVERATELPPLPATTHIDVASNTASRANRLVVMVLDDLHGYRGRDETVRAIAKKVVEQLGPESSMALIQTGGQHGVEVTEDRSRLMEAIDQYHGRRAVRRPVLACDGRNCDPQDFDADMSLYKSLQNAAKLLGGNDGRRRAFVLISENLAKDLSGLFGMTSAPDREPRDSSAYMASGDAEALAAIPVPPASYHDYGLLDMMDAMRRGGVATYSIDPRGELSNRDLMRECSPAFGFSDDPCLGEGQGMIPDWNSWVRQSQHGLEIMSSASGGFAVVNTNDFTSGISRIVNDLDNYYLIGFRNEDTKTAGYRPLEVAVKGRPELTLRYRRGYQIRNQTEAKKNADPLVALIDHALPEGGLAMRLHAVPMPHSGKEAHVAVAMELTVPRVGLESETARLLDEIRFGFYAIDLKGAKVREQLGQGARVQLSPRSGLTEIPDLVTYEITTVLSLPPGQYQIRASAQSAKLDKGGSVYLAVDVPDFSKMPFGLTDLVLGYADGPHVPIARVQAATPAGRGRGGGMGRQAAPPEIVLPFDPTLDRSFARGDSVRLFFQAIQQQPSSVVATISALAPDGTVRLTIDRPVAAGPPTALDLTLPLSQLAPGAYRLRVHLSDGRQTAEREIGFAVK